MRKILIYIFVLFILSSCIKDPEFKSFDVNLKINFDNELSGELKEGAKVVLNNLSKNYSLEELSTSEGIVNFSGIEPGFYSATVTHSFNSNGGNVYINGVKNLNIFSSVDDTISIFESRTNAFIIKEFYYSGSLTPAGNSYSADQYIEIYNNTSNTQYIDGLSIVEHESYGTGDNYWTFLPEDIVVKMIWTFPGDGDDYPVGSGKSVIIARDAIDHRDDPNGNPLCPVNLGDADFEFYVFKASGDDKDNQNSTNLIENLFTFRGSDVVFHMKGGSAIALVSLPGDNEEERKEYVNNNLIAKESTLTSDTRFFCKIPVDNVLDAVEVVFDESYAIYKRFPIQLDAGCTYDPLGTKSAKCIRRKIKEVINGRTVYQDTNNSSEDFLKGVDPKPRIYE
ncbi:MAG: DUF4876 domain-containing protein [Bacteroidetes bacterium]|nr:DUF4876 domain-containing protein [Bacteroidota bacterium]